MRRSIWLAGLVTVLGVASASPAAADPNGPEQSNFPFAFAYSLLHPTASPPGTNDWTCRPNQAHPNPVVLLHGTTENAYSNWAGLSAKLKADGYCLFAPNLGGKLGDPFQALAPIEDTAKQLGPYIDRVLAATGAAKVDLVGHSQGGMMPRYYLKHFGGAAKVDQLIGLAPSNRGTLLWNPITALPGGAAVLGLFCPACVQQAFDSDFIKALNAGGSTDPAVRYTVIVTKWDEVVFPHTSAYLPAAPNVANHRVQDYCLLAFPEHLQLSYDSVALRLVRNALDPATAQRPRC